MNKMLIMSVKTKELVKTPSMQITIMVCFSTSPSGIRVTVILVGDFLVNLEKYKCLGRGDFGLGGDVKLRVFWY